MTELITLLIEAYKDEKANISVLKEINVLQLQNRQLATGNDIIALSRNIALMAGYRLNLSTIIAQTDIKGSGYYSARKYGTAKSYLSSRAVKGTSSKDAEMQAEIQMHETRNMEIAYCALFKHIDRLDKGISQLITATQTLINSLKAEKIETKKQV